MKNENIICISWLVWDSIPLVMHEMMKRLGEKNRILFVDPPVAYSTLLVKPSLWKQRWERTLLWLRGVRQVREQFYVYYPPPLLFQIGHLRAVDILNQTLTARAIKRVAKRLRFTTPILWIYHPYAINPNAQLNEKLICYDCNDDVGFFYTKLFGYKRNKLSKMEEALAKKADVVFATSQNLLKIRQSQNPRTYYFPSGIEYEIFRKSLSPSLEIPPDIKNVPKPIVGFIGGMVNAKMNWQWIRKASEDKPDWSFVFIGPCLEMPDYGVTQQKNIIFLGSKDLESLPGYVKAFDVCIIPYKGKEFLETCFPTKVFEYLAAGKPVVSSYIPALEEFKHVVRLSRNVEEFISNIEIAMREGRKAGFIRDCVEIAKGKTWENRLKRTTQIIESIIRQKSQLNYR